MTNYLSPSTSGVAQTESSRKQKMHADIAIPVQRVRILRLKDVCFKTGMSRSTVYDWLHPDSPRHDAAFPKQIRLGRQSVGWLESEIDDWLHQRIANARDA